MDLDGRVALVTGAARRLGRAIARGLADAGAHVGVHYHSAADEAERAATEFRDLGVRAEVFRADLGDPDQVARLFAELDRAFGRLDVLVNSAALFQRRPVLKITVEEWDLIMALNLRAPFLCSQQAAPLMRRHGGGRIVNVSDVAAFQPWPAYAHYSIAKAGLVMMTRVLARALAPEILVNGVAPGHVLPPDDTSPQQRQRLAELTPLKRLGTPDDVVEAVLFLVRSNYVTGETIVVDGGKLLRT